MKKRPTVQATEEDLLVDLTFHNMPASLLSEFAKKIVEPYYNGSLNAAIQDLIHKTLAEQDFVFSHITHVRSGEKVISWR
jgi:tagatose-1,6-bisphosphate aldolase non-catalytic subunit AgaZ/GatZ